MPSISSGSNATFTVPSGYVIDVQCPGGWVQLECPVGTKVFEGNPAGQTFGPYSSGTAKLTSIRGDVYYEVDPGSNVRVAGAVPSLDDYSPSNPLYIAHRGSASLYPEESKLAYDNTLYADGVVALETDVQTLSDGALGLMHDSTVDRTTTGTGNVSAFNSTTFQALTMDSSVWLGSNYGDTLNPMMFQAFIDAYKGKALLVPEDKDFLSMTALVRALINAGVRRDQALVQCSTAANLATPVAAGYPSLGLALGNSPTPAAFTAVGATWAGCDATCTVSNYIAAGLKVLMYTVNRRYQRDTYLAQGVSGFFSDDPIYLRSATALGTQDLFARQTWAPGMLPSDGSSTAGRGAFTAPNWWGYPSATVPGTFYSGCLQGYLCPIAAPSNYTLTLNAQFDSVNGGDMTRWFAVFLGTDDQIYNDGTDAAAGYHFLVRANGTLAIYKKASGQASSLASSVVGSALSLSTEYTFKITVTPTTLTLALMNGSTVVNSTTLTDSTYRSLPYVQLGRAGCAVRFRSLRVA